ncbi:MAG: restriction endonuclease [Bacteroidales bacterium]
MNYWLHRISHHAELAYPLLDKGLISIGYSDFSEPQFIEKCSGNWDEFENYFDKTWGNRPRTRYNLWRFISEMEKGDYILVPGSGVFSIYEIIDDEIITSVELDVKNLKDWWDNSIVKDDNNCLYRIKPDNENHIDLGFFRRVKPIATNISRYDYADNALTARMKIQNTNACISDLEQSIKTAITAYNNKKPINLYSLIIETAKNEVLDIIKSQLNPDKFELLIQWYFRKIGASKVYIPAKNESDKSGDADIIATFEPIKTIIYVQAKFHDGETNSWALEQINEYKEYKDSSMDDGFSKIAWVISSADSYSIDCEELAKNYKVQLVNGIQFATLLLEAGISNINEAF